MVILFLDFGSHYKIQCWSVLSIVPYAAIFKNDYDRGSSRTDEVVEGRFVLVTESAQI
jgi:hypothetical protein